ncbi:MAG: FtsQ-type POTRA domain-containing protein [Verrucomicrobiaceae bacterium]|jgi:hypothetical protein|nr:FtsQ-type POTRA domain-containing protein [Verrucomicrobiaceae bacterium]
MPPAKKGSKQPETRSSRKKRRGVEDPRVINYEPESPVIREQEAAEVRRRGFRNAIWLIVGIGLLALGRIVWIEAFEKNEQFLLKKVLVNTSGPLSEQKIVSTTALTLDTNLLTLSIREVRARLERLPQVKSVQIHRAYNGLLTLDVEQRIPVAWLECARMNFHAARSGAGCLVDAEGVPMPCEVITKEYLALPAIRYDLLSEAVHGVPVTDRLLHTALHLMTELNARAQTPEERVTRLEIPNAWSIEAHFATAQPMVITFGVDDIEMQLERHDRLMAEARTRQWRLATVNFIARDNTPATFHGTPDVSGLTLAERQSLPTPADSSNAPR